MDNRIVFLYDIAPFVRKWFKNLRSDSRAPLYSGTWLPIFIKLKCSAITGRSRTRSPPWVADHGAWGLLRPLNNL